jgi:hypothetical protein
VLSNSVIMKWNLNKSLLFCDTQCSIKCRQIAAVGALYHCSVAEFGQIAIFYGPQLITLASTTVADIKNLNVTVQNMIADGFFKP